MTHSLKSLFLIPVLSVAAMACNGDNSGENAETTEGGGCSTEADFKAIITKDKMAGMLAGDLKRDVVFHSFSVDGPMDYTNTSGTEYAVITDKAYRVVTNFDVIRKVDIGVGTQTQKDSYRDVIFTCYTVNWSDGPNCVCYAEKNAYPAVLGEVVEEEKR
jgi:hypothetical protein